jgi:hypothetical protein
MLAELLGGLLITGALHRGDVLHILHDRFVFEFEVVLQFVDECLSVHYASLRLMAPSFDVTGHAWTHPVEDPLASTPGCGLGSTRLSPSATASPTGASSTCRKNGERLEPPRRLAPVTPLR